MVLLSLRQFFGKTDKSNVNGARPLDYQFTLISTSSPTVSLNIHFRPQRYHCPGHGVCVAGQEGRGNKKKSRWFYEFHSAISINSIRIPYTSKQFAINHSSMFQLYFIAIYLLSCIIYSVIHISLIYISHSWYHHYPCANDNFHGNMQIFTTNIKTEITIQIHSKRSLNLTSKAFAICITVNSKFVLYLNLNCLV